jgi:nicotinamide phosphoribosyltransferase
VFVVRPDSITPQHPTPESEMVWIMHSLWDNFGGTINSKGYCVINPKVRVLWGDGIDIEGIKKILYAVTKAGFATENIACFGMGGGLLQKVNRDTQRCAFKCSAQYRDGQWYDIQKNPKDVSKASKKGKLKLTKIDGKFVTVNENDPGEDYLKVVFENGVLIKEIDFDTVRKNAAL